MSDMNVPRLKLKVSGVLEVRPDLKRTGMAGVFFLLSRDLTDYELEVYERGDDGSYPFDMAAMPSLDMDVGRTVYSFPFEIREMQQQVDYLNRVFAELEAEGEPMERLANETLKAAYEILESVVF